MRGIARTYSRKAHSARRGGLLDRNMTAPSPRFPRSKNFLITGIGREDFYGTWSHGGRVRICGGMKDQHFNGNLKSKPTESETVRLVLSQDEALALFISLALAPTANPSNLDEVLVRLCGDLRRSWSVNAVS